MNVEQITRRYLAKNGHDGLCCDECLGCGLDDLFEHCCDDDARCLFCEPAKHWGCAECGYDEYFPVTEKKAPLCPYCGEQMEREA